MTSFIQTGIDTNFTTVLLLLGAAFILGLLIMVVYRMTEEHAEKSLCIALLILPVVVTALISAVNGNLGTGIAIMGVFALVRFRAKPTHPKAIIYILFDMSVGVILAAGYLLFAAVYVLFVLVIMVVLKVLKFGEIDKNCKRLKVTIPEDLDYNGLFDDIFTKYTDGCKVLSVKTTNLGALYEIRYEIKLKKGISEKAMLDEIRVKNGNLSVVCNDVQYEMDMNL